MRTLRNKLQMPQPLDRVCVAHSICAPPAAWTPDIQGAAVCSVPRHEECRRVHACSHGVQNRPHQVVYLAQREGRTRIRSGRACTNTPPESGSIHVFVDAGSVCEQRDITEERCAHQVCFFAEGSGTEV